MQALPHRAPLAAPRLRLEAGVIDIALLLSASDVIHFLSAPVIGGPDGSAAWWAYATIILALLTGLGLCWWRWGTSPGKALMGLRVRGPGDGNPSRATALIRAFGYLVSAVPIGLGFAAAAGHPRRQAWHDRFARTVVIDEVAEAVDGGVPTQPGRAVGVSSARTLSADRTGEAEPAAQPGWSRPALLLRVAGAVLCVYTFAAGIAALAAPLDLGPAATDRLDPLGLGLVGAVLRLRDAAFLLIAGVMAILLVRAWHRPAARLATFGIGLTFFSEEVVEQLGLGASAADALETAFYVIGVAALLRFAASFPLPLTAPELAEGPFPPGPSRRLHRNLGDLLRRARGRPVRGWGPADAVTLRRPFATAALPARRMWTVALLLACALVIWELRGVGPPAVPILAGVAAAAYLGIRYLRAGYRHAAPTERRSVLWLVMGLSLWLLVPALAIAAVAGFGAVSGALGYSAPPLAQQLPYISGYVFVPLAGVILPAALAMAILYAGAFDPGFLVRRTLLYGLVVLAGLLVFAGIEYILSEQLARRLALSDALAGWIAGAAAGGMIGPLHAAVKRRTDRLFRKGADATEATTAGTA